MTEYEFKKAILKTLRDISKELHEMNQRNPAPETSEKPKTKPLLVFVCTECGHDFSTKNWFTDEEGMYAVCPKCYEIVYSQN